MDRLSTAYARALLLLRLAPIIGLLTFVLLPAALGRTASSMTPSPDATPLATTPLHARHVALGARMTGFGGYDMPVQYAGILEEHRAVREAAGLFDVSHMGEVEVTGPRALDFVQRLVTNDASRLVPGRALYTVMCREDGGIVDDLLVYHLRPEAYLLVINAANVAKDLAWMHEVNEPIGATLTDRSDAIALLALQGPKAFEIAQALTEVPLAEIPYYHFVQDEPGRFFGSQFTLFSHTGYTGEAGLELYVDADRAEAVWDGLLETGAAHGLHPAGLGARDTLRLEAGFSLYGNDLSDETNPLEAGLGWVVKLGKEADFVGKDALAEIKAATPSRRLVGFVLGERGIPRAGYPLYASPEPDAEPIGIVTSGSQSPTLGLGIGLGYVPNAPEYTQQGSALWLGVRSRRLAVRVIKPPFFKR